MRTVPDNHAAECVLRQSATDGRRDPPLVDQIGRELRGLYGPLESEPLPEALRALAARLDKRGKRADAA